MKIIRILSLFLVTVMIICSAGACSDIQEYFANRQEIEEPKPELYGSDIIVYGNSKREAFIAGCIAERMEDEPAKPLIEKVEVTYIAVNGSANTFRFHVSNKNPSHFYNGVVSIQGLTEEFQVNVRMLAPDASEEFSLVLSEEPAAYHYSVDGGFYMRKAEITITHLFRLYDQGLDEKEAFIIVDAESITKAMAGEFADYFYAVNTIYNTGDYSKYYMVTEDFFNPRKRDSEYTIIIDMVTRRLSVRDAKGNTTVDRAI